MGVHCGLISVNNQAQHSCLLTSCWWLGGEYQKNKNEKTPKELRYSLIGKAKAVQSKRSNPFTTSQGQAGVKPSPEKQGSITQNSGLGR